MKLLSSSKLTVLGAAFLATPALFLGLAFNALAQMPEAEINVSPIVYEESNDFASYSLNGQKLTVASDNSTVTVRGQTPAVVITGNGNTVNIEAVDRIEIAGSNNTVTWASAVNRDLPKIVNQGQNNNISSGPVGPAATE
jgi:hypothetical protein